MSGAATVQIACEGCGAILAYQPGGSDEALVCGRCGARRAIPGRGAAPKDDYRALLQAALEAGERDESSVLDCGTCGAQTTLPSQVIAERCPFCGQPAVTPTRSRLLRPAAILPFRLDEKQARAKVVAWERALLWKPASRLGPEGGAFAMSAVYLPYWTFDWDVETSYRGSRGVKVDKDTRWTEVSGTVRTRLDGATIFGSRGVPREAGAELEPWDTDRVVGYQDQYLLGVRAETSALAVPEAGALAHRVLERQVTYDVECDIGGDEQRVEDKTIRYHAANVQLILLPVWITHFEHQGRPHRVLCNARTGEVIGERPVSRARMWATLLAPLLAVLVGAAVLPGRLGWHPEPAWRAPLGVFLGLLLGGGLAGFIAGSVMVSRARAAGPSHHKQLYVTRPAPGTRGLEVDPATIWRGVLQDDPESRGALVQLLGFASLFVSMMPFFATVGFGGELFPMAMMFGFSAIALGAFVWAAGASMRARRRLLGLDQG